MENLYTEYKVGECKIKWTNNKKIGLMIFLLGIIFVILGVSYAYFTALSQSGQQVVKNGTLSILYETGQDINGSNIISTEEENAQTHQFTINNNGTLDAHYTISFVDISLTKNNMATFSSNLNGHFILRIVVIRKLLL